MSYCEICTPESLSWREKYADVFAVTDKETGPKTVFRYRVPYSVAKEAIIQKKHLLSSQELIAYYQAMAQCIHRHVEICNHLSACKTPSILFNNAVTQETDANTGQSYIYIETEPVQPLLKTLFKKEINIVTLLDTFIRLSVVIRDLSKDDCNVCHRGISLDHVYVDSGNKILMGGFYYATSPHHSQILTYLPDHPRYLPKELLEGGQGSAGTDMQTISLILYNILSGLPWDTAWSIRPVTAPAYAPDGLADILRFGMQCQDEDCNSFRRQLLNYRKELNKTDLAAYCIPIPAYLKKEYVYR